MKFTKEEAVKELAAKYKPNYGEPAKWERTIQESVDHAMKLIGEESEMELDAFVKSVMPFLDTTAGFIRKETSEVAKGLQAEIEELKKKQPAATEKNDDNGNDELLKRLEALEKANEESRRLESVARKRNEITEKLKEKGVKDADWIELMLRKATVAEDTDADKEAGEYLEIYNKMHAGGGSDNPLTPKGEPTDKVSSVIAEAAEKAKERLM